MKVKEALKRAKGYLVKYGWIKNDIGDRRRGFCVVGALDEVDRVHKVDLTYPALRVLAEQLGSGCVPEVVTYNNAKRRTKKQILSLLDKAIKLCTD